MTAQHTPDRLQHAHEADECETPAEERARPVATRCPQCRSFECGPYRCRFTMVTHADYRDMCGPDTPEPSGPSEYAELLRDDNNQRAKDWPR